MSKPSEYRVVYVEPGKPAVEKKIGTELQDLQAAVGGMIECIYAHETRRLSWETTRQSCWVWKETGGWTMVLSLPGRFLSSERRERASVP